MAQDFPLIPPGVWLSLDHAPWPAPRPALFLDRDGVVVVEADYVSDPDLLTLEEGAAALIGAANRAGTPVVAVTNQSGIARGFYGWAEFAAVESRLKAMLAAAGARLDATCACPFHPDFMRAFGAEHAAWRKPGPRMLTAVAERLNLALGRSWMVGDRDSDIAAARAAGLAGAVLVTTGYGQSHRDGALALATAGFVVRIAETPAALAIAIADAGLTDGAPRPGR